MYNGQVRIMNPKFNLSEKDLAKYHEQGYLVVENVVSEEDCDFIQKMARPFADDEFSVVLNIHRRSEFFGTLMRDPAVVAATEKVQESEITGLNSQYLFKRPSTTYGKQSWTPHQDNSYPKAPKGAYIIVHLALEHSDPGNGGLIFWPGSQVEDILPFEHNKSWKEEVAADGTTRPGQTVKVPEKYTATDMFVPKGGLCFMHGNLIHGSHPNRSPYRARPQYSMGFLNRGVPYDEGKTSRKIPFELKLNKPDWLE